MHIPLNFCLRNASALFSAMMFLSFLVALSTYDVVVPVHILCNHFRVGEGIRAMIILFTRGGGLQNRVLIDYVISSPLSLTVNGKTFLILLS